MKKATIALVCILVMSGCRDPYKMDNGTPIIGPNNAHIEVIDGCQYIVTSQYGDGSGHRTMTHKGNCNNPIHQKQ